MRRRRSRTHHVEDRLPRPATGRFRPQAGRKIDRISPEIQFWFQVVIGGHLLPGDHSSAGAIVMLSVVKYASLTPGFSMLNESSCEMKSTTDSRYSRQVSFSWWRQAPSARQDQKSSVIRHEAMRDFRGVHSLTIPLPSLDSDDEIYSKTVRLHSAHPDLPTLPQISPIACLYLFFEWLQLPRCQRPQKMHHN